MTQPVIRASDISLFAFCERAWGYAQRGEISRNQNRMAEGSTHHRIHAGAISAVRALGMLGALSLLIGLALVAVQLLWP
ncbi:MAG: hypothetical protein P8X64_06190 [Anaerolineales bacterium]